MKTHKTLIALLIFVFAFSIGSILSTTSEYKFPNDSKLEYKVTNDIKQVTTMMGQEMVTTVNSSETMHILSLGLVDDNNFKVEFYIDDITVKADIPQVNVGDIDFSFIAKKKSSALISKKGVVSSVEAIDAVEFPSDQITQAIAQQYNPMAVFSKFFLILPENELKVGESWGDSKTETTDNMGGEMKILTDYSYTVSEKVDYNGFSCLKIISTIKLSHMGQATQMGQEIKISGKGQGDAVYYFAPQEGKLIGYEVNHNSDINMDLPAMDMTIPMTSTVYSKVELVK